MFDFIISDLLVAVIFWFKIAVNLKKRTDINTAGRLVQKPKNRLSKHC